MNMFYKMIFRLRSFIVSFPRHIVTKDEYIKWLVYANPGLLHPGNVYLFEKAISKLPSSSPILEIGSFCGLSTNIISYFLTKYGRKNKIFTCDIWETAPAWNNKRKLARSNISRIEYMKYVRNIFKMNVTFFSKTNKPFAVMSTSDNFFKAWSKGAFLKDIFGRKIKARGKFSFCYIDGDHSLAQARKDFQNADKYLEKGGFVLFDDSAPYSGYECAKLMEEIMRNNNYELICKNPNFLFRKIK